MANKSKPAVTLAEIIIVIVILAVIAGVFLAMPKKNVGKMDRTKYYVAYDLLKRFQDERMAVSTTGTIDISDAAFCTAVNTWLNTINVDCGGQFAQLTNGMILSWGNAINGNERTLTVDIDGTDDGSPANNMNMTCNNAASVDNQDCHSFIINNTGGLAPTISNPEWMTFKVYTFNADGTTKIWVTNVEYNTAITQYCCRNQMTACQIPNGGGFDDASEGICGALWGGNPGVASPAFMEAVPPLGK